MTDAVSKVRARLMQDATEFVEQTLMPRAAHWDAQQPIDRECHAMAAQRGLTSIQLPTALGGLGLDFSAKTEVAALLAQADFGFALSLINTHGVAHTLHRWLAPEVAQRWLPDLLATRRLGCTALTEPHTGSDFAAITTRAVREGAGWVLTGEKAWIINAVAAQVVVVYAQTEPGSGARGIAAFVVDAARPGFERTDHHTTDWLPAMGTSGFRLEGYRAQADEMIHPPGLAFKRAMESINGARTYVAAMCCGMLERSLRIALEHGLARPSFGRPLADHQGWRWPLVQADVDLRAAQALVQQACQAIDAQAPADRLAAQCKLMATQAASLHLPRLQHALGAAGLRAGHPLNRHVAAAQMACLIDGSSEMLLERVFASMRRATFAPPAPLSAAPGPATPGTD